MTDATPPRDGALPVADPRHPAPTDAARREGRAHPGTWIYAIDPAAAGDPDPAPAAIMGAWHAGADGELEAEFHANPHYIPSPPALGWRPAETALEELVQAVASGIAPTTVLLRAFPDASVWVFEPARGTTDLSVVDLDGHPVVYAFSDAHLAADSGWEFVRLTTGQALLAAVPDDTTVLLNAGADASAQLSPRMFAEGEA